MFSYSANRTLIVLDCRIASALCCAQLTPAYLLDGVHSFLIPQCRRKSADSNRWQDGFNEISKIFGSVSSRCRIAFSAVGVGRASAGQEFSHQDQTRHAFGIAELLAYSCSAAKGFLRQTGLGYRSHSDGGGFGGAGAAQSGDRLHHDTEP